MENSEKDTNESSTIFSAIKWWERKRIAYSLITLAGGLLVIMLRSEVPNGLSPMDNYLILGVWLFGANIFYTCGWGAEILLNYYLKIHFWSNPFRLFCFIIGCLFSFVWMFILTRDLI